MAMGRAPQAAAGPVLRRADDTGGDGEGLGEGAVGLAPPTPPPGISPSRARLTVAVLCYINLLNYMDRFTVAGVLPDIEAFFSIGDSSSGLLQTVFISSYMVLAPVFGYLGDRHSRKRLLCLGIALWSAVTLASSFVPREVWGAVGPRGDRGAAGAGLCSRRVQGWGVHRAASLGPLRVPAEPMPQLGAHRCRPAPHSVSGRCWWRGPWWGWAKPATPLWPPPSSPTSSPALIGVACWVASTLLCPSAGDAGAGRGGCGAALRGGEGAATGGCGEAPGRPPALHVVGHRPAGPGHQPQLRAVHSGLHGGGLRDRGAGAVGTRLPLPLAPGQRRPGALRRAAGLSRRREPDFRGADMCDGGAGRGGWRGAVAAPAPRHPPRRPPALRRGAAGLGPLPLPRRGLRPRHRPPHLHLHLCRGNAAVPQLGHRGRHPVVRCGADAAVDSRGPADRRLSPARRCGEPLPHRGDQ
ncbi:protein spinster homolog 1 isoform X4 [Apteryx rowi]|uniref:protein spinster homolog 1 isoform X4 n=1 Tax=Apteryx rowi TaxID=308060 RepID=UPI000E1CAD1A|nr:protein spinster homolog 1 isoform X4 [Apteryx rowi]